MRIPSRVQGEGGPDRLLRPPRAGKIAAGLARAGDEAPRTQSWKVTEEKKIGLGAGSGLSTVPLVHCTEVNSQHQREGLEFSDGAPQCPSLHS